MATSGAEIVNPRTGQRMIFLQTARDTDNALLRVETYNAARSPAEPEHVHPFQESYCEVLAGTLRFRINGLEQSVKPGESFSIPRGVPHHFWNDGDLEAHAIQ